MKKILVLLAILIALFSFSFRLVVNASKPSDFGLKEGDLISAIFSDDPDVYIINEHGYKRLFLNPEIFKFYSHLGGFTNVKLVTQEVRDSFPTSGLFRNCEDNDQKVFGIDVEGEDTGQLHWVNTTGDQAVQDDPNFFKKVFCINKKEFSWYKKASEFTSVTEVPKYDRIMEAATVSTQERLGAQAETKNIGKVIICHYPPENINAYQTLTIDASALKVHLDHGDTIDACLSPTPIPIITITPTPTITISPSPTASQSFSPTPTSASTSLSVSTLYPVVGPRGSVVTLLGTGFYSASNPSYKNSLCFLTSTNACINAYTVSFSDTEIRFVVPSSTDLVSEKKYNLILQTYNGSSNLTQTFKVYEPTLTPTTSLSVTSLSPTSGPNGTVVTLTGTGFYSAIAPSYKNHLCFITNSGTTCASAYTVSTSNTEIQFIVPLSTDLPLKTYYLDLQTYTGSNRLIQIFTVTPTTTTSPTPTPTPVSTSSSQATPILTTPTPTSTLISGAPAPPISVTAVLGTGKISVTWSSSSTKFFIQRSVNGGVYQTLASTAGYTHDDSYNLVSGSTYRYKILSCDNAGYSCYNGTESNTVTFPILQNGTATCSGLNLTFQNGKNFYVQGETATYTFTCTPGGTTPYVGILIVRSDGTAISYNSASNVASGISTETMSFATSYLAPGNYTLQACFSVGCSIITTSLPFSVTPLATPTPTPTASTSFDFNRDLYLGLKGSDVKQLQALLVNEVSYSANLITGYFGNITRDAVKRLQEKYGVRPVSGYFGEITRKALTALISN